MADRSTLHFKHLEAFEEYLQSKGWVIEPLKGYYEVLRARHPERKRPLIVYRKGYAKEHCSVDGRDYGIIRDFLRNRI